MSRKLALWSVRELSFTNYFLGSSMGETNAHGLKRPQIKGFKGRRPPSLLDLRPPPTFRPERFDFKKGGCPSPSPSDSPLPPFEGHAHSFVEFRDCLASVRIVVVVGFLDKKVRAVLLLAFVALLSSLGLGLRVCS